LYCETLREAGVLVGVFTCLDAAFASTAVSLWGTGLASLLGIAMVSVGVYFDPEV
jgi:hypothetical protein